MAPLAAPGPPGDPNFILGGSNFWALRKVENAKIDTFLPSHSSSRNRRTLEMPERRPAPPSAGHFAEYIKAALTRVSGQTAHFFGQMARLGIALGFHSRVVPSPRLLYHTKHAWNVTFLYSNRLGQISYYNWPIYSSPWQRLAALVS